MRGFQCEHVTLIPAEILGSNVVTALKIMRREEGEENLSFPTFPPQNLGQEQAKEEV